MSMSIRRALALAPIVLALVATGCLFSPDNKDPEPDPPAEIPAPDTPEHLLDALEVIYNDTVRSASQRLQLYTNLFPERDDPTLAFIFLLQQSDIDDGLPPSWGRDVEIAVHERMFEAQENRDIFSLRLTIRYDPAAPLEFPPTGQESWMEVRATNISLRLLFNPDDGLEVNNGRARFKMAPDNDENPTRWYIAEWKDEEV